MSEGTERWPPFQVTSLDNSLGDLSNLVDALAKQRDRNEELAWLARLLVVRSTGYIEQSVQEISRAFVARKSGGLVRAFAHSWLERSRNPTPDALQELLGRFDSQLAEEFTQFMDDDDQKLRRELSFMVDRRNRIAHGLNEGIGHQKALMLVGVARETTDWFILRLNPMRR